MPGLRVRVPMPADVFTGRKSTHLTLRGQPQRRRRTLRPGAGQNMKYSAVARNHATLRSGSPQGPKKFPSSHRKDESRPYSRNNRHRGGPNRAEGLCECDVCRGNICSVTAKHGKMFVGASASRGCGKSRHAVQSAAKRRSLRIKTKAAEDSSRKTALRMTALLPFFRQLFSDADCTMDIFVSQDYGSRPGERGCCLVS